MQDDQCQQRTEHRGALAAEADGDADGGAEPERGRGGEALDLTIAVALENGAGAEKADTRRDALDHAADGVVFRLVQCQHHHEHRGAESDQHVGAQAGGLALGLALETEQTAEQGGH